MRYHWLSAQTPERRQNGTEAPATQRRYTTSNGGPASFPSMRLAKKLAGLFFPPQAQGPMSIRVCRICSRRETGREVGRSACLADKIWPLGELPARPPGAVCSPPDCLASDGLVAPARTAVVANPRVARGPPMTYARLIARRLVASTLLVVVVVSISWALTTAAPGQRALSTPGGFLADEAQAAQQADANRGLLAWWRGATRSTSGSPRDITGRSGRWWRAAPGTVRCSQVHGARPGARCWLALGSRLLAAGLDASRHPGLFGRSPLLSSNRDRHVPDMAGRALRLAGWPTRR